MKPADTCINLFDKLITKNNISGGGGGGGGGL